MCAEPGRTQKLNRVIVVRIKAYTLLEVTIAMLITALAVGIMYSSYSLTMKLYAKYADRQRRQSYIAGLSSVLNKDLFRCESAKIINNSEVELRESSGKVITYRFLQDCILRNLQDGRSDTFKLAENKVQFFFEGRSLHNNDCFDQMLLSAKADSIWVSFSFSKVYSSEQILKFNANN